MHFISGVFQRASAAGFPRFRVSLATTCPAIPAASASTSKEAPWIPMLLKPSNLSLLRVFHIDNITLSRKQLRNRAFSCFSSRSSAVLETFRASRGAPFYNREMTPPRPELEKQYMSSNSKPKKEIAEPRPSARFVFPLVHPAFWS